MGRAFRTRALLLFALLGSVALAVIWALSRSRDLHSAESAHPLLEREHDYVGANACKSCHADNHESWSATFHSRMTQLPSETSVLGRFDGETVTLYGASATPFRRGGSYFFRLPALAGAPPREAEVALTVGSRRYQQYFERHDGDDGVTYRRLPLLWHVAEARWLHLNGVFLEPDNNDWSAHNAVWNANCVFCHNTGVAPGLLPLSTESDPAPSTLSSGKRFDSTVADLGIACEACHGPGQAHAEREQSVLERFRDSFNVGSVTDIINPEELAQKESAALCGQCHSQRLPNPQERIWEYLANGPSFRPGDLLEEHVTPVNRDTVSLNRQAPNLFRDRFWSDGTARLTAYEYLGLTQSPCYGGGEFTCTSCHTMHSGDPRGQLEAPMRGDAACTQCHAALGQNVSAHTHHADTSSGSRCMNCHMPRTVYGVLSIHPSHRVESPDVRRDVEGARPNACALCHLDKSAVWLAEQTRNFWGTQHGAPSKNPKGIPLDAPLALVTLHGGDPVERAIVADALGRKDSALSRDQRVIALGNTLVTLGDSYAAVRTLARGSALALDEALSFGLRSELTAFDVQGDPAVRHQNLLTLLQRFAELARASFPPPAPGFLLRDDYSVELERVRRLLSLQTQSAISVGE